MSTTAALANALSNLSFLVGSLVPDLSLDELVDLDIEFTSRAIALGRPAALSRTHVTVRSELAARGIKVETEWKMNHNVQS